MIRRLILAGCAVLAMPRASAWPATGEWATPGYDARVRIAACTDAPERLCGTIVWLWNPNGSDGLPVRDAKNPDPNARHRSLEGLQILNGFHPVNPETWEGGTIYNPEDGRSYRAKLRLTSPDILEVRGCVLFFCETQIWRRAGSVCPPAAVTDPKVAQAGRTGP